MGGGEADYLLGVGADTSKLHEGMGHANEDVEKFGEKAKESGEKGEGFFSGISGGVAKLGLLSIATGGAAEAGEKLVDFFSESVKKAGEADAANAVLYNTLKQNATGWNGNTKEIEEYVNKQKLLGFATTDVDQALGNLATTTHSTEEAQSQLGIAEDLARSKHIDLTTASKLLQKADLDSTGALKKLGIEVDKNATKEQLLAAVHKATAGAAEAYSETSQGAMDKLGAVFDTFQENVGHIILPFITQALGGLADFISSDSFQGAITTVMGFITNAFGMIGSAVQAVWPIIQPFVNALVGFWTSIAGGGDVMQSLGTYFQNLGSAIGNAWNVVGPALGGLLSNILGWIGANGPSILAQLGQWAQAFGGWIWNQAIPWMLQAAGQLISALWGWIQANGPGILQQLGTWAQQFGAWLWNTAIPTMLTAAGNLIQQLWGWIQANGPGILQQLGQWAQQFGAWLWNTAIPAMLQGLGSLIGTLWNWIVQNGPGIAQQLLTWATAFGGWVLGTALPWLLQQLGSLIGTLWNWIVNNGPTILAKLETWAQAFRDWVMNTVLPQIPGWLGNIAGALWTWITNTAKDLGGHLVNEWIPAFWNWITGPGGVKDNIGTKLGEVAQAIWTWITTTAGDALHKVLAIGQSIVDGIKLGIQNGWQAFVNWVTGLLGGLLDAVKNFFGIHSPSTVWAAEVGAPMANGVGVGFSSAWVGVAANLLAQLDGTWGAANERVKQIAALAGQTGGSSGPNNYQGSSGGRNNGRAGSGGTGGKAMLAGGFGGGGFGGGGVVVNVYFNGQSMSPDALSEELGLDVRVTTARSGAAA